MDEFFKKHASKLTAKHAVDLIDEKVDDAKHYYCENKMFESLKCLKEANEMITDFIYVMDK